MFRPALSALGKNVKVVQSGQSIQSVIDACSSPAAANPFEVQVPPGHEGEQPTVPNYVSLNYRVNQFSNKVGNKWDWVYTPDSMQCVHCITDLGGGRLLAGHGAVGTYSLSVDYGKTWSLESQISDYTRIYNFLYLGDDIVLAFSGASGKIARSTNAGATWSDLGVILSGTITKFKVVAYDSYNDVICVGGDHAAGANTLVFRSTDKGLNWTSVTVPASGARNYDALECLGRNHFIMVVWGGFVYQSTDAGTNWSQVGEQIEGDNFASLLHIGGGTLWLGTGSEKNNYEVGKVLISKDGGEIWVEKATLEAAGAVTGFLYVGNGVGFAGTRGSGYIFKTVDYGEHWYRVHADENIGRMKAFCDLGNGVLLAGGCKAGSVGPGITRSIPYE